MSFEHAVKDKKDYDYIRNDLRCNSSFLEYLLKKDILSKEEVEKIKSKDSIVEKAGCCIDVLKEKGRCKGKVLRALFLSGQAELADYLEKDDKDIDEPQDDFYEILKYSRFLPVSSRYVDGKSKSHYTMEKKIRGLAIIINIVNFKDSPSMVRHGSNADCKRLEIVFKELHFEVETWNDPTKETINSGIEKFEREEHKFKKHDAFIMVIMSHGRLDCFLSSDKEEIKIKELVERIGSKDGKCKSLLGKPKLFFIQACQLNEGTKTEEGTKKGEGAEKEGIKKEKTEIFHGKTKDEPDGGDPFAAANDISMNESFSMRGDGNPSAVPYSQGDPSAMPEYNYLGKHKDTIVAYATLPGDAAYRETDKGSFFIQSLCDLLYEKAHSKNILELLTDVGKDVSERNKKHDQVCRHSYTLQKTFEFFPGYSRE